MRFPTRPSNTRRLTGAFGAAGFVVFLAALLLYFVGPQPVARLEDAARFSDSVGRASASILARATLADPFIMACFLVSLAGFRATIRQARPDREWASDLVFGGGLVVITLELAGDALQGGAALDASAVADPAVVRSLWESSFVFYGAIGLMMSPLLLASAGYAILPTRALPRWTGRAACAAALVNPATAPSIFGGIDYTGFSTASGYVTFIAQGAMLIRFPNCQRRDAGCEARGGSRRPGRRRLTRQTMRAVRCVETWMSIIAYAASCSAGTLFSQSSDSLRSMLSDQTTPYPWASARA
jgi:hypothetical protein